MPKREVEGDMVMGWPDRKRLTGDYRKDEQGRVNLVRSPMWDLQGRITPVDLRYTIAQMKMPEPVIPDEWTFKLSGLVENELTISLAELQKFPSRTVRCVHECAGNEGTFLDYLYRNDGTMAKPKRFTFEAFTGGLSSGGEWTGVPLKFLLEKAKLKPEAFAVLAQGFDRGIPASSERQKGKRHAEEEQNFEKCVPMDKAMDDDTLIAYALNGEYLRHVHGAPMRLIVPGWAGNWSVKWLENVKVLDHMHPAFYQTEYFIYGDGLNDPNRHMITAMGCKSMITEPRENENPFKQGFHLVRGKAYSGRGMITRVEVSADGGKTWKDAVLEEPREKWIWTNWSFPWEVTQPGTYTLMSRAHDEAGRTQPATPWNFQKKMFDGIVPVEIEVEPN